MQPNIGSHMNGEGHVRFWERPEVRLLRATRQQRSFGPMYLQPSDYPLVRSQ